MQDRANKGQNVVSDVTAGDKEWSRVKRMTIQSHSCDSIWDKGGAGQRREMGVPAREALVSVCEIWGGYFELNNTDFNQDKAKIFLLPYSRNFLFLPRRRNELQLGGKGGVVDCSSRSWLAVHNIMAFYVLN